MKEKNYIKLIFIYNDLYFCLLYNNHTIYLHLPFPDWFFSGNSLRFEYFHGSRPNEHPDTFCRQPAPSSPGSLNTRWHQKHPFSARMAAKAAFARS